MSVLSFVTNTIYFGNFSLFHFLLSTIYLACTWGKFISLSSISFPILLSKHKLIHHHFRILFSSLALMNVSHQIHVHIYYATEFWSGLSTALIPHTVILQNNSISLLIISILLSFCFLPSCFFHRVSCCLTVKGLLSWEVIHEDNSAVSGLRKECLLHIFLGSKCVLGQK